MRMISVKFGLNKSICVFSLCLLLITFFNCKKEDIKIPHKISVSESIQTNSDSVQLKIDSVFYDKWNVYFKINIQNNSSAYYYFPVDYDYSYLNNYRTAKIDSMYYSYFHSKYFDKLQNQILGNIGFYDGDWEKEKKL